MVRSVLPVACFLLCHACGAASSTSDSGSAAQDAGGGADGNADRPEGGTAHDGSIEDIGGQSGAIIRVLRGGAPIGARLDLGEAGENEMGTPIALELENTGDAPFELGEILLIGGDTNAFVIDPPAMNPITAGGRAAFSVTLHPPSVGDFLSRVEVRGAIGSTRVAAFEVFGHGGSVVINPRKLFVAFGMSVRRVVSEDANSWTESVFENQPMGDNDFQFRGACYGETVYVGVGGAMLGRIMWTQDGIHWNDASDDRLFLGGCAYGNGYFVAVGSSGRHIRSADGMTWTDPARLDILNFRGIAFGGGRFIAVGDGGRRAVTENGVDWTHTATGGDQLMSIGYGVDRFVAVGANGRTMLTLDGGETWEHDQSTGTLLRGVAYGNSTWVAVGQNRTLTSTDGFSWSEHALSGAAFSGLTFGDGKFVGIAYPNRRYISTNGADWEQPITDADPVLITVAFGTGR